MATETEVLPGTASPQSNDLPESFTKKPEAPGIDTFFKGDEGAPIEVTPKPAAQPVVEEAPEIPAGIAARLAAKNKPPTPPVPPMVPVDPVEAIESEMRTKSKGWKPSEGWDKLKSFNKTLAEEKSKLAADLAEAQKKLTTIPAGGQFIPEEVTKLKDEHKALSERLLVLDLENHPDFRRQYVEPKQAELVRARDLLEAHGLKDKDVNKLLSLPRAELGKAVAELVKDIPAFDQVEVSDALRKAYSLEQNSKVALGRSKEILQGMRENSAVRAKQAFESRWAPVAAGINEHVVKMEVPATATPEQRTRAERYNSAIDGLRAKAESIAFSPMDEGGVAENAIKAAAYDLHVGVVQPQLISEMETLLQNYGKLATELKALKSRNPNRAIQASGSKLEDATNDPAKMDHKQAADHFFTPRQT